MEERIDIRDTCPICHRSEIEERYMDLITYGTDRPKMIRSADE